MMLRLSTSLWGHIFAFGHVEVIGRMPQTCKRMWSLLSLASGAGKSLTVQRISLSTMGAVDRTKMEKLGTLGVRHLDCTGHFTVAGDSLFASSQQYLLLLRSLHSLHIGRVSGHRVWLAIVEYCKRLESLVVDDANCPPVLPLKEGQPTFDHLRHMVLPQKPYRIYSDGARLLLELRRTFNGPYFDHFAVLKQPALLGDAYSLWCIGQLLETGTLSLDSDKDILLTFPQVAAAPPLSSLSSSSSQRKRGGTAAVATTAASKGRHQVRDRDRDDEERRLDTTTVSAIAWFYRRGAERGYATAQFNLYRFLQFLRPTPDTEEPDNERSHCCNDDDDDANDSFSSFLEKAVVQSEVSALNLVAHISCANEDFEEMARCWQRAADQGDLDAMYQLGSSYFFGMGVPMDDDKAYKWLKQASLFPSSGFIPYEPGPPWSYQSKQMANLYLYLGICQMVGIGCVQDLAGAITSFARSCEHSGYNGATCTSLPKLGFLITQWTHAGGINLYDSDDIQRHLQELGPPCPQTTYWQLRLGGHHDEEEEDRYWSQASVADHVMNAFLESCVQPPNDLLLHKLLSKAANAAVVSSALPNIGPCPKGSKLATLTMAVHERIELRTRVGLQVRAFLMLGQMAEKAGDTRLAQTWYKRAASSPCQSVQAHRKLLTLQQSS